MVGKKGSRPVSKVSSAAAPAQSTSTTLSANKSSILRSAFSPSEYQLALFASVIQGLDANHLRIHDVNSGRLQCDHAVNPRETITSLDWGYYGDAKGREQHQKKKRKRSSGVNGAVAEESEGDVVVAFGTSTSEIRMYSPAEDKITGTLSGVHERGIRDFKFTIQKPSEGWSIGGDGKLVQWDLRKGHSMRVISLPSTSVSTLARPVPSNPPVLCASQTPYLIDLEKGSENTSFSAMRNSVHTLISSSTDLANLSEEFLAADSDRYINVFNAQQGKLLGSLVSENGVDSVSLYQGAQKGKKEASRTALFQKQVLAAVTRDGAIELFSGPFHQFKDAQSGSGTVTRSLRKSLTRRADAVVKIIRPDKSRTPVPVVSVSFHGSDLVVAWVEGGVSLAFDRIRWQGKDSEELTLQGEVEIVKARTAAIAGTTNMNGAKDMGKSHVDETHAVVEQGGMAEGFTSAMDVDASDDNNNNAEDNEEAQSDQEDDVEMADADEPTTSTTAEPSFGELLRAHATHGPIDVTAALEEADEDEDDTENHGAVVPSKSLSSGLSLSTVLSQSLKTNDTTLLESCFHTTDLSIVRSTIQRLDSSLAATLLTKLAERISTRPGRYGHLLVWVQWTCVAHGGAIAGQPHILREMSALFKVMDQRSKTLNSLLLLKGKLDMLDAQLGLRQSLRRRGPGGESEDEEGVIYVEGQEDVDVDAEESDDDDGTPSKKRSAGMLAFDDEEDDDEDMPLAINGVSDNEESDDDNEESDDDELVDNEAEVSVDDGEEISADEESDEDGEEDGSIADFIAASGDDNDNDDDDESDLELAAVVPPVSAAKKGKTKGASSVKGKAGKR